MEQEAVPTPAGEDDMTMEQEAVPAPAGEDDTASSAAAPPFDIEAESAEPSAAGSAPQSPFSSGSEPGWTYSCCGQDARDPDFGLYLLFLPDYEADPWEAPYLRQGESLRDACRRIRDSERWRQYRAGTCLHTDQLYLERQRFSAESTRSSATAASSLEPSAVSAPPEVPQPKAIYKTPPPGLPPPGSVDPHRVHELGRDISRQGWSTESPRSSVTAASSREPSAVSARPPTKAPQPKVIYKTPPGYIPPAAPQYRPTKSPPPVCPPTSPPVKAPPLKHPPPVAAEHPPPKHPPPVAPKPPPSCRPSRLRGFFLGLSCGIE